MNKYSLIVHWITCWPKQSFSAGKVLIWIDSSTGCLGTSTYNNKINRNNTVGFAIGCVSSLAGSGDLFSSLTPLRNLNFSTCYWNKVLKIYNSQIFNCPCINICSIFYIVKCYFYFNLLFSLNAPQTSCCQSQHPLWLP